jgi:imidazole glycerol-phosphate synthase subunit HisF
MLRPRITPCLLIKNNGLVKTIQFNKPKYVGDPLNAVKIFNEKEADELIVLDIDATTQNKEPDYRLIKNLALQCRMPLCYGGGVKTVDQVIKIISLGVEKVAMSSSVIKDSKLISRASEMVGSQSIVVVIDAKKNKIRNRYDVYSHNAMKRTKFEVVDFAKKVESLGAGEIVLNSIDRDGTMQGYDFNLVERVRNAVNIPMTVLGGAASHDDIQKLVSQFGIMGASAGSLFVFKGKYRAVLINYPNQIQRDKLFIN